MTKISKWARETKARFNEKKSKTMLMSRRKREERGEVVVYINNNLLKQVKTMKYLWIIIDKKLTIRELKKQATDKCTKLISYFIKISKTELGFKP